MWVLGVGLRVAEESEDEGVKHDTPWESIEVIIEHLFQRGAHLLPDDDPLGLAYNTVQLWYEYDGPERKEMRRTHCPIWRRGGEDD
jgi:hypothetical protein